MQIVTSLSSRPAYCSDTSLISRRWQRIGTQPEMPCLSKMVAILIAAIWMVVAAGSVLAQTALSIERDRLLDTYAQRIGVASRCEAWNQMTAVQRGVFLTVTDLLGKRSFMVNNYPVAYFKNNPNDGCLPEGDDCTNGCKVPDDQTGWCDSVTGYDCWMRGKCYPVFEPRTNFETALNHVTRIWAVNGAPGNECGGGDFNRLYFSADDSLIYLIRNFGFGLPEWDYSSDPAGPHGPFNNSSETISGQPRGQMHFWRWDYEAQILSRFGVEGIYDPHIVEIDIDYNFSHDSNPECYYDGTYGRFRYQNFWFNRGLGGSAEYEYDPCL